MRNADLLNNTLEILQPSVGGCRRNPQLQGEFTNRFGGARRAGVVGDHPSLTDLDQGDLKFTTDFRGIYASVLDEWLKAPSEKILNGRFRGPSLFRS